MRYRAMAGIMLSFAAIIGLTACTGEGHLDNHVYIVEKGGQPTEDTVVDWLDINNTTTFNTENIYQQKLSEKQLFLAASADGQFIFYEEALPEQDISILKGPGRVLVNLYVADQKTNTVQLIAEKRPFIVKTGWNQDNTMIAFNGEGVLTVYDIEKKKVVLENELETESVSTFFWSPLESRKLYLEQPYNTVGLLYYVEPQKKAELYETAERLYYKAQLDEIYYYGTRWGTTADNDEAIYTVIANKEKETVKVVGQGSYRDHYLRSVLLSGADNFGLTYIANVNQVNKSVQLTDSYVYDAKFIAGGRCIYTTASEDDTANLYELHLVNNKGEELKQWTVSGSSILLSEDGKTGYCSGPAQEIISFSRLEVTKQDVAEPMTELEKTLTGAGGIFIRLSLGQDVSKEEQDAFYANTEGLEQMQKTSLAQEVCLVAHMRLLMVNTNEQGQLCLVSLSGFDDEKQQIHSNVIFQLIEQNKKWYVLHFEMEDTSEEH